MALTVQIKKRLEGFRLEVDFTARDGEPLALLGASGCGKSMTLQCVAGIRRPDWGRIELDGEVLFDSGRHIDLPPQRRRVGYLFQQYALFPNMTVEQNIAAALGRLPKEARRRRTAELTALFRLEGLERRYPRQLSGGQQQRAAIARSLIYRPAILLADEPTGNLDQKNSREIIDMLKLSNRSLKQTILLITHDEKIALEADRIVTIEDGRILADEKRR